MWHDWLRKRIADNVPYDQIVRDILTATSRDGHDARRVDRVRQEDRRRRRRSATRPTTRSKKTLDLFWRRQQQVPVEQWGEKVAAAFLGVRLECAQCHKHPTDRWTQDEYWAFANLFAAGDVPQNNQFSSPDVKKVVDAENAARTKALRGRQPEPDQLSSGRCSSRDRGPADAAEPPGRRTRRRPRRPRRPGDPVEAGEGPADELADWMTAPDNPFFARSFVNRVWAHYFGVGLVNPVDDFSLANPPTNARLLDALAKDFVESGYDIRKLERTILVSRTYQLVEAERDEQVRQEQLRPRYVRPLMAEQVVDVLNAALGVDETFSRNDDPGSKARTARNDRGRGEPAEQREPGVRRCGSSAGRRGRRRATASGRWSRPCRRRSSA